MCAVLVLGALKLTPESSGFVFFNAIYILLFKPSQDLFLVWFQQTKKQSFLDRLHAEVKLQNLCSHRI